MNNERLLFLIFEKIQKDPDDMRAYEDGCASGSKVSGEAV